MLHLEDVTSKEFLPDLLRCSIKPEIRELTALPPRLGGMGTINPIKAAVEEFKNSVCLTKQLAKKIVEQDRDGCINNSGVVRIAGARGQSLMAPPKGGGRTIFI